MATYYIGADVHCNNTELAIEKRGKIMARYSVPTSIPAISTVLDSLQGKKIFAMEETTPTIIKGFCRCYSSISRSTYDAPAMNPWR